MKKHLAHLAAALAVTLLFGAAAGPLSAAAAAPTAILDEENTAAAESRLNQSWLDMEIEYNDRNPVYQLYLSSAAPDDWVYQWYSTNPAVATVDRNGLVTAQKPGKTTIVANTYTTTLRCDVTVVSNVGRVTLNKERLYLENIGGTAALRASVAVENGDAVPITWTTSNPAAATVDPFGLVTAVGGLAVRGRMTEAFRLLFFDLRGGDVPNEKNLIPFNRRTESEQRAIQSAGGIASGAARRRKKSLKEAADLYLSLPVSDKRRWNKIARRYVDPEDVDNQMAMIIGLTEAATAGDARAAKVIIELLGDSAGEDDGGVQIIDDL